MHRRDDEPSQWSGTDRVGVWEDRDAYRWTAEHAGEQKHGSAGSAEAAHALGMRSVFQRRRSKL